MLRFIPAALGLAGLCACAGHDYALENYKAAPRAEVTTRHDRFGVWDNRPAGKLLVQVQRGGDTGLIWNPNVSSYPRPHFQEAAERYLADTGRRCAISDSAMILEQRWEFSYRCA